MGLVGSAQPVPACPWPGIACGCTWRSCCSPCTGSTCRAEGHSTPGAVPRVPSPEEPPRLRTAGEMLCNSCCIHSGVDEIGETLNPLQRSSYGCRRLLGGGNEHPDPRAAHAVQVAGEGCSLSRMQRTKMSLFIPPPCCPLTLHIPEAQKPGCLLCSPVLLIPSIPFCS